MDDFIYSLIGMLLALVLFVLGLKLACWIGESDLPFWVKLWLLSK